MGEAAPEGHGGGPGGLTPAPPAELVRWEDAGAGWRVEQLAGGHARVTLLACTGEAVDAFETSDPAEVAYLRRRGSSEEG